MSLYCDRNIHDAISTGKIQKNKHLTTPRVFSRYFSVEMTSSMFLSQHRDTQVIFYLFNIENNISIPVHQYLYLHLHIYVLTYIYVFIS